ncbi:hypothetical protein ACFFJT_16065 [Dyella flava]|uniref:Lipoprotein n=1 Tax=Dyella flava TaxID=1920170 RepID=A0ABS2K2D4_9GAMM|nr:hypothetical protein [Dyella flava]MBM7125381.1 hypothetical protein [Dyella flava]GLQ51759.1 hypothetical protein GCM10010872_32080 [Dyella flava]
MKCTLVLALLALPLRAAELPSGIVSKIPKGYEVMTYAAGQLHDEGHTDYLVVIHHTNDTSDNPSPRPLLIYVQNPDNSFTLAARNDHVVMRADEGGQCDPFDDGEDGLVIKNRYFTVQNSVACGDHWTDYITFHYDARQHTWLFHKEIVESWVQNDDPNGDALKPGSRKVIDADVLHPVKFAAWLPRNK